MWMLYLVNAFQASILYNLVPYATSEFSTHSLLTVIAIVANSMTAALYIPLAKVLDLWGRAEGFVLMVGFATLGLIMMAVCKNLATFCAAQVCSPYIPLFIWEMYMLMLMGCEGLLFDRIWRSDLHHRCHHSRCFQVEESSPGLRFHLFALCHYSFCWK